MDFATCIGISIVFGGAFIFIAMARDALNNYKKQKTEERQEKMSRHPILYNIIGALIAWKAIDIWNRSRQSDASNAPSNDDNGRSVYDDLNNR